MAYLQIETAGFLAAALLLGWERPRLDAVILWPMVAFVVLLPQVRLHIAALLTRRGRAVERPCGQLIRAVVDLLVTEELACTVRLLACAP